MARDRIGFVAALVVCCAWLASTSLAGETPLTTQLIASNLSSPVYLTHAPGDFDRLFVVERAGKIRVIRNGQLLSTPFLDITSLVSCCDLERGFLGLAFHPNYQSNGYFYARFNDLSGRTTVMRYTVSGNPDLANASSGHMIFRVPEGVFVHIGGSIQFGHDGYLYIGTGDGNTQANSQDLNNLHGKLLRIDVNGDDFPADPNRNYRIPPTNPFAGSIPGADEIWAYGLRNPFRFGFDRQSGDLWIGDVGQGTYEEVDLQPPSSSSGSAGRNYGWPCMEGHICTGNQGPCLCSNPSLTWPIWDYEHILYGCSITGGKVYRGCAIEDLQGTYFCADFCTNFIMSFRYQNGQVTDFNDDRALELDPPGSASIETIVAFGDDAHGELYICDMSDGEIFKIIPAGSPSRDCENGSPGDINGDGTVNVTDLLLVIGSWGPCPPPQSGSCPCDIAPPPNGNDTVNVADLLLVISEWG